MRMTSPVRRVPWRLMLITERAQARRDFLEVIEEVCAAGIDAVQLREKDLTDRDYHILAGSVHAITKRHGVPLIINHHVEVALALGAAGIHLGGRSLPLDAARKILPEEMVMGASTHTLEEVRVANAMGADYLTFGPVYDTPAKVGLVSTTGLDPITELKRVTSMPILALGGIKRANLPDVLSAGFDGAAAISEIMAAERPGQVVTEMRAIFDEFAVRAQSA